MTVTYTVNGRSMTPEEFACWRRQRRKWLRSIGCSLEDGLAIGKAPSVVTDTTFIAHHRSEHGERRRAEIAKAARQAGLPEDVVYDPTLAKKPLDPDAMFRTRAEWKRKLADTAARIADTEHHKPVYRLHPRLVREEIQRRAAEDPDVLRRDQRELAEEIVERHGLKG